MLVAAEDIRLDEWLAAPMPSRSSFGRSKEPGLVGSPSTSGSVLEWNGERLSPARGCPPANWFVPRAQAVATDVRPELELRPAQLRNEPDALMISSVQYTGFSAWKSVVRTNFSGRDLTCTCTGSCYCTPISVPTPLPSRQSMMKTRQTHLHNLGKAASWRPVATPGFVDAAQRQPPPAACAPRGAPCVRPCMPSP